ncbi:MAG: phosphoribosylamine--glycine ligase [Pirellulales bacterium]|nr:phosphoribosylamine--glycine ligase [Pirellulales bacterium]
MNVLIVGNGGREHALAWKIAQSPRADRVFVAPGNAGTAQDAENVDIRVDDFPNLINFAKQNQVQLTVVGPEGPLADGITNAFAAEQLRVFGPSKQAAQLEASKVFCKTILRHADVQTAEYRSFRDADSATHYLNEREDKPVVVKADGLAAGKGVVVCDHRAQAIEAVNRIARNREFGQAGDLLLIEERLVGEEVSVLAITDGRTLVTLPAAQDHKPAYDGGKGPNTGGMGAFSPAPVVNSATLQRIEGEILVPAIHAMKRGRHPFQGVLYAGLMITSSGPKVLEFNVRFGDPECQPLMMRLKTDLLDILEATVDQRLDEVSEVQWDPRPSVCVVMASEGYPGSYERGHIIRGLDDARALPNVKVFHGGTATLDDQVVTDGGRVLGVTALGDTISAAKFQAYKAVKCIRWDGAWCRKDISDKAIT